MDAIVNSTRLIGIEQGPACVSFGSSRRDLSESVVLLRRRAVLVAQASMVVLAMGSMFSV